MRFQPNIETDLRPLESLILKGEGNMLDFKRTINDPCKIARTLAAFANHRGGTLLVGVGDNGDLLGTDPEEEMFVLHKAAEDFCDPPVDLSFTVYEDEGLNILQADVLRSLKKPHLAPDEQGDWQIYIRAHDKTLVAGQKALKQLEDTEPDDDNTGLDSKALAALNYLEHHPRLTAKVFSRQMNISLQRANRILVSLVHLGQVLQLKDEQGQYFVRR